MEVKWRLIYTWNTNELLLITKPSLIQMYKNSTVNNSQKYRAHTLKNIKNLLKNENILYFAWDEVFIHIWY